MKKKSGFSATDESLELAALFAKELQLPFHRSEVDKVSENLQALYYNEIVEKLNLPLPSTRFDHGAVRKIIAQASVNHTDGTEKIYIDEQLDFWLLDMCFINAMATFKKVKITKLEKLLSSALQTFRLPYLFESERQLMLPAFKKHVDLLPVSHAMGKAMLVFIICHEIAHLTLKHFDKDLEREEEELEADEVGYSYFKKVILHPDKSGYIALQEMYLCAPVLFFNYLDIIEHFTAKATGTFPDREGYPKPLKRAEKVTAQFNLLCKEHDRYVLDSFLKGLDTLRKILSLPVA